MGGRWRASVAADGDRGYTLIELLVAVAILGIAGTTVVGGIGMMVKSADYERKESVAALQINGFAEAVTATGYLPCATAATYQAATAFVSPPGYTASISAVAYWDAATPGSFDPSGAPASVCPGTDSGLQRITLTVSSSDGRDTETLRVVKRQHQTGESP
jgi:prepilin-type N-terminal cleavage/methylation domain-containing protein